MKVTVLGVSGMLGSMVLDSLSGDPDLQLSATVRDQALVQKLRRRIDNVTWHLLDAESFGVEEIAEVLNGAEWVINAIGVIKPYIHDDNAAEVERALKVNALFPHLLAHAAAQNGCRVLQIATDCAYSGRKGQYTEKDEFDPLDVYGKTKNLGEVYANTVSHLRCSIIGPEMKVHSSLMDWFLGQPQNSSVNGYTNHQWNGVTTLQFARLCRGVIKNSLKLPHMQHVIPSGSISKAELLQCFAREFKREDITVNPGPAKVIVDRTLATTDATLNRQLWEAAGYNKPPTVPEMVAELAGFNYRFSVEGDA